MRGVMAARQTTTDAARPPVRLYLAGCNGYAALLGFIEAAVSDYAGDIPLILKCNNHDVLHDEKDPLSAVTASVGDALRLGCVAVGFTIYPGSSHAGAMYEQLRGLSAEAKAAGLPVVVWSYPRGSDLSKDGETAIVPPANFCDVRSLFP